MYVGKGMLKQHIRLHSAHKKSDKIEVSFMPEEKKQLEDESSHIDRHKNN